MCKMRFLDTDILGPTCQLSFGQERSGEQHRKNTDSLSIETLSIKRTVFEIFDFKNAVTLKPGLGVRQGHWKCHRSIERI